MTLERIGDIRRRFESAMLRAKEGVLTEGGDIEVRENGFVRSGGLHGEFLLAAYHLDNALAWETEPTDDGDEVMEMMDKLLTWWEECYE